MFSKLLRSTLIRRCYSTPASPITPPAPKKIGAFKGGFLGFLSGVTLTGFGSYYYLIDEYRSSNKVIVGDVLSLEKTIGSLEEHVRVLESKINKE